MKWLGVVGLFVLVPNVQAAVVYSEGFETGAVEAIKEASCYDKGKQFRIQSDIVRSGKYAAYLAKPVNKGKRCEIVPIRSSRDVGNFIWGKEYWSGFSFYIPSGAPNNGFGLIHQHHADSPEEQPYCGYAGGNGFSIRMRDEFSIHLTPSKNLNLPGKRSADSGQEVAYTFPLEKDKWFDVVMNFKYSDKSDGFWTVWVNGKQVIDRTGSNVNLWMGSDPENLFKGACGSNKRKDRRYYQQHGIYVGTANTGTIIYDEVRLGDANSSYADVAPASGKPVSKNTSYRAQSSPNAPLTVPEGLELEIK